MFSFFQQKDVFNKHEVEYLIECIEFEREFSEEAFINALCVMIKHSIEESIMNFVTEVCFFEKDLNYYKIINMNIETFYREVPYIFAKKLELENNILFQNTVLILDNPLKYGCNLKKQKYIYAGDLFTACYFGYKKIMPEQIIAYSLTEFQKKLIARAVKSVK